MTDPYTESRRPKTIPDSVIQEIKSHRDAIIAALVTYERVGRSMDSDAPEAAIADTIRFVDNEILGVNQPKANSPNDVNTEPDHQEEFPPNNGEPLLGDSVKPITCRDDFDTGDKEADLKRRCDFIATYGLVAFERLPRHRTVKLSADQMCREDLETLNDKDRSSLLGEIGMQKYEAIIRRRRQTK